MPKNSSYDSAIAKEFESVWQALVLERTSATVTTAVDNAMKAAVNAFAEKQNKLLENSETLGRQVEALKTLDEKVGKVIAADERHSHRLATISAEIEALEAQLQHATASVSRIAEAETKISSVMATMSSAEFLLKSQLLANKIGEIVKYGRDNQRSGWEIVDKIEMESRNYCVPQNPIMLDDDGRLNSKPSWILIIISFFVLIVLAYSSYNYFMARSTEALTETQHDTAETGDNISNVETRERDAGAGQAAPDLVKPDPDSLAKGWTKLTAVANNNLSNACAGAVCPSFEDYWSAAGTNDLYRSYFIKLLGVADLPINLAVDCAKIVDVNDFMGYFSKSPQPLQKIQAFCVNKTGYKVSGQKLKPDDLRLLAESYVSKTE